MVLVEFPDFSLHPKGFGSIVCRFLIYDRRLEMSDHGGDIRELAVSDSLSIHDSNIMF